MEWMKISDVIVSLAGHNTIMEVISLGIPNIIVPIDNHPEQLKNAMNIERYGISIIEDIKKISPKQIAEDINMLINDLSILERSVTVREKFSKYNGTSDALDIILGQAKIISK